VGIERETQDTFTLRLEPPAGPAHPYSWRPGQFNMLYVFGVGEAPLSTSGDPADAGAILHTIRAVGPVTNALSRLHPGDVIGLRGPFGRGWPVDVARGQDVVIVSGGIGLAPLRPAIYHLLRNRQDYGRVVLLHGVRTPRDMLFAEDLQAWSRRPDCQALVIVGQADASWHGHVGLVTDLFPEAQYDPQRTIGLICGPELMIRVTLREFEKRGVTADRLYVSLERNMQCAIGFCGHCQFGPSFLCLDGPVFRYDKIKGFFHIREA
jgi:NAD(P)H-flavin reductase